MISHVPPAHLAIVPKERLLSGLDELFALLPQPAAWSSSMVFITGPSRTADIETDFGAGRTRPLERFTSYCYEEIPRGIICVHSLGGQRFGPGV